MDGQMKYLQVVCSNQDMDCRVDHADELCRLLNEVVECKNKPNIRHSACLHFEKAAMAVTGS